jgi:DegV family protein with EDD domain
MSSICILTDSAAQFPQLGFSGKNDIRVIPFDIEFNGKIYPEGKEFHTSNLPPTANEKISPRLLAPSAARFQEIFLALGQHYRDVVAILTSSALTPAYSNAYKAMEATRGQVNVTMIDSQVTSVGLGLLVQNAAEAVAQGQPLVEVERLVRSLIPHTYMMLCTPGMSYLYQAGFVDQGQAFVSEMLGMLPIFTLEEGRLSSVEKVRNSRALSDFMQEFICEFDALEQIALLQSNPGMAHEARLLREHAQNYFPQTPFSELTISPPLATLIGPRSLGLVVIEKK